MTKYILVMTTLFLFMWHGQSPSAKSYIDVTSNTYLVAVQNQVDNPMSVKQQVKGNDVYVECVISDFTFSKREDNQKNKKGYGHLKLYLNGKKIDDIYTAAFIIKGLPAGKHQIMLELVHNDGTPYDINKEFDVTVS